MHEIGLVIIAVTLATFFVIYTVLPSKGYGYLSRLTCTKCSHTFDYRWLPGGSFTAIRLGNRRYMRCPSCHKWSMFNVWSTRVP
ncbi:MAG: hypothetical protein WA833_09175 [Nitrosotalea sp.]